MKSIKRSLLSFALLSFLCFLGVGSTDSNKSTSKWYEGGTLHRSTVQDWNKATYENKLATAADMALNSDKIASKVKSSGNIDTLRPYAQQLVTCIDEASAGQGYQNMKIAEIAASCMILMGW